MNEENWHQKCFYRVSLKAVIKDEKGRVLVVKEKNNSNWNLPGGGMDYGEDEYQALKRELHEEVGYSGSFSCELLGIWPHYLKSKEAWQMWVVFAVQPENYNFSVGEQSNEISFMNHDEFKDERIPIYKFSTMS